MNQVMVGDQQFEVTQTDEGFERDGKPFVVDAHKVKEGYFHLLHGEKSYRAEIIPQDNAANKKLSIKVNGNLYSVEVKTPLDLLLEKMGMDASSAGQLNKVVAPMPGLIVEVQISEGQEVNEGDPLLVLEAMKMENVLKSSGKATVKKVLVKNGDRVEKGQPLVEFT